MENGERVDISKLIASNQKRIDAMQQRLAAKKAAPLLAPAAVEKPADSKLAQPADLPTETQAPTPAEAQATALVPAATKPAHPLQTEVVVKSDEQDPAGAPESLVKRGDESTAAVPERSGKDDIDEQIEDTRKRLSGIEEQLKQIRDGDNRKRSKLLEEKPTRLNIPFQQLEEFLGGEVFYSKTLQTSHGVAKLLNKGGFKGVYEIEGMDNVVVKVSSTPAVLDEAILITDNKEDGIYPEVIGVGIIGNKDTPTGYYSIVERVKPYNDNHDESLFGKNIDGKPYHPEIIEALAKVITKFGNTDYKHGSQWGKTTDGRSVILDVEDWNKNAKVDDLIATKSNLEGKVAALETGDPIIIAGVVGDKAYIDRQGYASVGDALESVDFRLTALANGPDDLDYQNLQTVKERLLAMQKGGVGDKLAGQPNQETPEPDNKQEQEEKNKQFVADVAAIRARIRGWAEWSQPMDNEETYQEQSEEFVQTLDALSRRVFRGNTEVSPGLALAVRQAQAILALSDSLKLQHEIKTAGTTLSSEQIASYLALTKETLQKLSKEDYDTLFMSEGQEPGETYIAQAHKAHWENLRNIQMVLKV